ncbi:MAG TPA: hypothetical protein VGM30_17665, partial [Puia sp.]
CLIRRFLRRQINAQLHQKNHLIRHRRNSVQNAPDFQFNLLSRWGGDHLPDFSSLQWTDYSGGGHNLNVQL